jgi:hypothetical protein
VGDGGRRDFTHTMLDTCAATSSRVNTIYDSIPFLHKVVTLNICLYSVMHREMSAPCDMTTNTTTKVLFL